MTYRPSPLATAINNYGAHARAVVGSDSVVSWPGLWLLLAIAADVVGFDNVPNLGDHLGMPPAQAAAAAEALVADKRPGITAAAAVWLDSQVAERFSAQAPPIPTQRILDAWASDNTDGMSDSFPIEVTLDTVALLATAMLANVAWQPPLLVDADGRLVLNEGVQAIVHTDAAGFVAVAKPMAEGDAEVISVIAAPDVEQPDVWRAVEEVVELVNNRALHHGSREGVTGDGHSWTIRTETQRFQRHLAPTDHTETWSTHLPAWEQTAKSVLTDAPGVADIATVLLEGARDDAEVLVQQAARAKYDAEGFAAAAVTAMAMRAGSVPDYVNREVTKVRVDFDRPHALTAIGRGGIWEGIRLFDAWVMS
ncbi:hypothetical protein HH308_03860 [Gordonia sp. TBRC 11910]|uniref:Uncharacterized protein n=1 Tax=Gordonia asplenii TaxID=2725283 RepID=A0A848KQZ3_9ACTN|nr:hypothetical protein [Gordonia asplenii]NMO00347.1 hypothetical protein [Gordonia asplenii]